VTKPVPSKTHGALEDLAVTRDVTARKLAEKAIHKREEEYRSLANSMSHLVWMASPDRHIFWYNQCWCEYTGSSHRKVKREAEAWQRVPSRDVSGSCRVAIILFLISLAFLEIGLILSCALAVVLLSSG
jgi:PAS domain-containing protein